MTENKQKQKTPVRSKEDIDKSSLALRKNLQRRKAAKATNNDKN